MFRILIAEDDKGTRRLMEDTLADAGMSRSRRPTVRRRWSC